MTTIYYMELGRLTMAHYCSLGNQPYLVALPSNSEQDIKFEFVRLGNMKDVNEHHIYTHKLEFQDENEMAAHCGGWKDQAPYKEDRVFRVKR